MITPHFPPISPMKMIKKMLANQLGRALAITSDIDTKLSLYSLDHYRTFIWTRECARYLQELIEFREKREGKLNDTDYLFSPSRIKTVALHQEINKDDYNTDIVKRTAKLVGIDPTGI